MTDFIEIYWTSGSLDEARRVCRSLVKDRVVASAQIIPWIESVYIWNDQLETTQESKVVLKARADQYEAIKVYITENCSYEIPEITYQLIDGGNESYLEWLSESTAHSL